MVNDTITTSEDIQMIDVEHEATDSEDAAAPDDYGTSRGFFSFASQLGRQLTQDAMDLSTSAVETAKYLAVESTKVVEKASLMAQESLAEAFEASEETHLDMILDLPWVDAEGCTHDEVKDGVFSISKTKANFHRLSLPTLEPIFDIDRFVQIAPALLALDDQLRQRHFELSYKLAEDVFWGNYFYHCHVLRVEHGLSPYMPIDGRVVPMAIPDTNQAADDDASALHVDEEEYGGVADDVADGRVEAAGPISTTQGDQKPPTTSAFSTMKSNLLHRSVQAKEKMQTIKRKIHFPSPDKIKDMQSSLLRRKSSVTESLERMSIPTMSSFKRSPSTFLRNRSKSGASEPEDVDTDRLSELGTPPSATSECSHEFDD